MATRVNFLAAQRESAFQANAEILRRGQVDGVEIALPYLTLQSAGVIYYCENCLFCHTDRGYFDVDHLVPDRSFRVWGNHADARAPENMVILCKSVVAGDLGCNQSKGARHQVPKGRGLAYTRAPIDMNCTPVRDRPFPWT